MSQAPDERFHVSRELYSPAPEGIAVYAQNTSYVSTRGQGLVESFKHEALHFDGWGNKVYYHPLIQRRLSPDGGRTWHPSAIQSTENGDGLAGRRRHVSIHTLDETRNVLLSLHCTYDVDPSQEMFAKGILRKRTGLLWYELSFDAGEHWTPARQVIDERPGHDEKNWAPGMTFGQTGAAIDLARPVWLQDGSVVFGLSLTNMLRPEEEQAGADRVGRFGVGYLRGRWNSTGTDMTWRLGAPIVLKNEQSPMGCCEPTAACLGGVRLFNVMRCQGDENLGVHSTRYATLSNDAGQTWSEPSPLCYEDGRTVWSPASLSTFIQSSKTGHWYWVANILPGPVYGQMPRYPLCIARFDTQRLCILRDSVRVIQDRPPGMPEQVRYTNWGIYQERGTGDLILTLPEQPKLMDFTAMTRPEHYTADCCRYRVVLPE
jgi:hypothetical protein